VAAATPKPNILGTFFKPKPTPAVAQASMPAKNAPGVTTNTAPASGGGGGLVWVNSESHVFHHEGSRYYGKTKQGKYMTEAEALKEGDRAAAGGR
jgi:hypothetical protein